jgi:hypothetical protein
MMLAEMARAAGRSARVVWDEDLVLPEQQLLAEVLFLYEPLSGWQVSVAYQEVQVRHRTLSWTIYAHRVQGRAFQSHHRQVDPAGPLVHESGECLDPLVADFGMSALVDQKGIPSWRPAPAQGRRQQRAYAMNSGRSACRTPFDVRPFWSAVGWISQLAGESFGGRP